MAKLEVRYADGLVETKSLSKDRSFLIGSDSASDLRLEGESIQSRHCVIRWVERRFRLDADPNAKNVFVGVNPVTSLRLKPNAEFSIGDIEFRIHYEPEELGSVAATEEGASDTPDGPIRMPLYRSRTFLSVVAALLLLAGAGIGLYFLVQARGAERTFDAARRDLNDRLYAKAISGFDRFLERYPTSDRAGEAAYLRARARVEQFTESSAPVWSSAHEAAKKMVAEVGQSREFRQRPTDVSDLLTRIALGLAEQARDRSDPAALDLSIETVDLIAQSVPKDSIPRSQIQRIQGAQEEARFAVNKGKELAKAIASMESLLGEEKLADFYREYVDLIHRYGDLKEDSRIRKLLLLAAEKQISLVRFEAPGVGRPAGPLAALPSRTQYARTTVGSPSSGPLVPVQVADVLYGVDSGTAEVAWRTAVGYPVAISATYPSLPMPWLVAYRSAANELLLVDPGSGAIQSRLALTGLRLRSQCEAAAGEENVFLVAAPDNDGSTGVVLHLRIAGGEMIEEGRYVFPQPIVTPPAIDAMRNSILVVGEQGVLYQIDLKKRTCDRVYPLGHEAGAIRVAPVMAGRFLFLAESAGVVSTSLRCFVVSRADGSIAEKPSLALTGVVDQPPINRMGRLFLSTDSGQYTVAEIGAEGDEHPLTKGAEWTDLDNPTDHRSSLLVVPSDTEMWALATTARRFQVRVDESKILPERDVPLDGHATSQSVWTTNRVVAVAHDRNLGGVRVLSIDPVETAAAAISTLGRRPSLVAVVDKRELWTFGPNSLERLDPAKLSEDSIVPQSPKPSDRAASIQGRAGICQADSQGVTIFDDKALLFYSSDSDTPVVWKVPGDAGGASVMCGDGALVPSRAGFVYWVEPREGKELSDPFAAPLREGSPVHFTAVAAVDATDPTAGAFAATGDVVFLLQLSESPSRVWTSSTQRQLDRGSVRELIALSDYLWCILDDEVLVLNQQNLEVVGSVPVRAGSERPTVTIDAIVLATADGKLVRLGPDPNGKPALLWEHDFSVEPAGRPAIRKDAVWVALPDGSVVETDLSTGSEIRRLAIGRAVASGPYLMANELVVVTADGSLCRLPLLE